MSKALTNAVPDLDTPVVIGVSGHRNLADQEPQLLDLIAGECRRIKSAAGDRPFIVLSPLAEGADRMVAKVAMETLGARLFVPLPLPQDSYEMDFAGTRDEFRMLLAKADAVVEAPIRSRGTAWTDYGEARNRQYAWVGAYVVEHAHVLFALWDGKPARGIGGTAHVVHWYRDGIAANDTRKRPNYVPLRHTTLPGRAGPLQPTKPRLLIHITPATLAIERYGSL